jgi:hypothetical protein
VTDPDRATSLIDELIAATEQVERRLEAAGEARAHDWMFALREALLDWRRILPLVATLPDEGDRDAITARVREIAFQIAHVAAPHAQGHLTEVLEAIDPGGEHAPSD